MKIVVFENETTHYWNCFLRMFKKSQNYCDRKIRTDGRTDWTDFSEEQKLSPLWKWWQNLILNVPSSKFRFRFFSQILWNALSAQSKFQYRKFFDSKKWSITFLCFRVKLIWQFLRRMNFFLTSSFSRFQILSHFFPKHHTVSCHDPLNYPTIQRSTTLIGHTENPWFFESIISSDRLSSR